MGTPEFANPSLQKLHQSSHQVVAVVTGQDKPVGRARGGRGRKVEPPPVKRLAGKLGYPLLQPASLKDDRFQSHLADMAADLLVVVAFRILPDALLECVGSLLRETHAAVLDVLSLADQLIKRSSHLVAVELPAEFYVDAVGAVGRYCEQGAAPCQQVSGWSPPMRHVRRLLAGRLETTL